MRKLICLFILASMITSCTSYKEVTDNNTEIEEIVKDENIEIPVTDSKDQESQVVNVKKYEVKYELFLNGKTDKKLEEKIGDIPNTNELDLNLFDIEGYTHEISVVTSNNEYVPYKEYIYDETNKYLALEVEYDNENYYVYKLNSKINYAIVDNRFRFDGMKELNPTINDYLHLKGYVDPNTKIHGIYKLSDIEKMLNQKTFIENNILHLDQDVSIKVNYEKEDSLTAEREKFIDQVDSIVKETTEKLLKNEFNVDKYMIYTSSQLYSNNNTITDTSLGNSNYEVPSNVYNINTGVQVFYLFDTNEEAKIEVKVRDNVANVSDALSYIKKRISKIDEGGREKFNFDVYYTVTIGDEYQYSDSYLEEVTVFVN